MFGCFQTTCFSFLFMSEFSTHSVHSFPKYFLSIHVCYVLRIQP